jgi:hypothetical protein
MRFAAALAAALIALLPLAAPAQQDPESVYARFHRSLHAGDLATMIRYGSEPGASELRKTPPDQAKGMLELMKKLVPQSYTIVGKDLSPDGSRATLRATGRGASLFGDKQETQYGTIKMVKQGGEWKVDESSWDGKPHAAGAKPAAPAPAAAAAPKPAAAKPAPAKPQDAARPKSAPPVVGSMDSASERKLGTQKPPCVYKPVMTAEDMEACR